MTVRLCNIQLAFVKSRWRCFAANWIWVDGFSIIFPTWHWRIHFWEWNSLLHFQLMIFHQRFHTLRWCWIYSLRKCLGEWNSGGVEYVHSIFIEWFTNDRECYISATLNGHDHYSALGPRFTDNYPTRYCSVGNLVPIPALCCRSLSNELPRTQVWEGVGWSEAHLGTSHDL